MPNNLQCDGTLAFDIGCSGQSLIYTTWKMYEQVVIQAYHAQDVIAVYEAQAKRSPCAAIVELFQGDLESVHDVLALALPWGCPSAATPAKQIEDVCHAATTAAATLTGFLGCILPMLRKHESNDHAYGSGGK